MLDDHIMDSKKILGLIAVLLLSLAFVFVGCVGSGEGGKTAGSESGLLSVMVSINNGSGVISKTVSVKNGSTAFDVFNATVQLSYNTHPVYGIYVTGVNGLMEDSKAGKYWQYYVDGELAPVGVGAFVITKNVSLEFRYEKPAPEIK
jgi:hypothetical protein